MKEKILLDEETNGQVHLIFVQEGNYVGVEAPFYGISKIDKGPSTRKDAGYRLMSLLKNVCMTDQVPIVVKVCPIREKMDVLEMWYRMNGFLPTSEPHWLVLKPENVK